METVMQQLNEFLAIKPGKEQFNIQTQQLEFDNIYQLLGLPKTIVFAIKAIFDKKRSELQTKDNI